MNVWADDPWAEDATPPRKEPGSSLPQRNTVANALEDDAGWGDFESSEDNAWASDPWSPANGQVKEEEEANEADPGGESSPATAEEELDQDDALQSNPSSPPESLDGAALEDLRMKNEEVAPQDGVDELSSGSGSTITTDEDNAELTADTPIEKVRVHEEGRSVDGEIKVARPMSSSSETTNNTEIVSSSSTRTSFDQGLPDVHQTVENGAQEERAAKIEDKVTRASQKEKAEDMETQEQEEIKEEADRPTTTAIKEVEAKERKGPEFQVDVELINKLFKPRAKRNEVDEPEEENEDEEGNLIDATSTRKMWYRLSRPLTLRGFLSGDSDDTYTRVNWPTSHVRKETVRIVSKWSSEDRMHGKTMLGAPLKSSFGWDEPQSSDQSVATKRRSIGSTQPTPVSSRFPHSRQPSMTLHPSTKAASPIPSFGWSTSPLSPTFSTKEKSSVPASPASVSVENPWRRSIPSRPSSLLVSAASLDAVFATENNKRQSAELQPMSPITGSPVATKKDLTIDTALTSKSETTEAEDEDEDDEWGEMVQSPPPLDSPALAPPEPIVVKRRSATKVVTPGDTQAKQDTQSSSTSPVASKQAVPDGPLSPARRAAFNAARVTRTLSSQHASDEVSSIESAVPFEDFTKVKLRKTSTALQIEQLDAPQLAQYPSPVIEQAAPLGSPSVADRPQALETTNKMLEVAPKDDLSMFESPRADFTASAVTAVNTTQPTMVAHQAQRVQSFLAQLPDMSYMLK